MTASPEGRSDVVVIGAGVVGLCTARLLAEAGAEVTVLEAHTVGDGASGRGPGQVLAALVEHPYRVVHALGEADAAELYEAAAQGAALLDRWGLLQRGGGWWVALDDREPDQVTRSATALQQLGRQASVVDAEGVRATLGLSRSGPALHVPSEGTVQPLSALGTLCDGARGAGAELREHWPVTHVHDTSDGLVVRGPHGGVHCEVAVYAAGSGVCAIDDFFVEKVVPVREQAWSSLHQVATPAGAALRAGYGYTWWRSEPEGLSVGGCRWATPHLEVGETDPVVVAAVQDRLAAFAHRLAPDALQIGHRAWIEAHTCDNLPIVGPLPGNPRRVAAVGTCGNDWGLGPALARSVADGLMGSDVSVAPWRLAATRFL
ncbi:MAG: FAD-binding oxidoreductase [Myxococcales bacterium]|nr:FAD-binding oxidoreductase [Myxococcales bacterium]